MYWDSWLCLCRVHQFDRCHCGHCETLPTGVECVCCYEIEQIKRVLEQYGSQENISCITEHKDFDAVCLNIWVLQAAYFVYRQRYGTAVVQDQPLHE